MLATFGHPPKQPAEVLQLESARMQTFNAKAEVPCTFRDPFTELKSPSGEAIIDKPKALAKVCSQEVVFWVRDLRVFLEKFYCKIIIFSTLS